MKYLDTHPRTTLFGLLTLTSALAAVWCGYEEHLLAENERPITWYARRNANRYPLVANTIGYVVAFVAGVALTHFIIDAADEPLSGRTQ